VATLTLDIATGLGFYSLDLRHMPRSLVDTLRAGADAELAFALSRVGFTLSADASDEANFVFQHTATGTVVASVPELEALADAVSRLVEPREAAAGDGPEIADDGARRYATRLPAEGEATLINVRRRSARGPTKVLYVHLEPMAFVRDISTATVAVLKRVMPTAAPDLSVDFLDRLRVIHTAIDSGEEWMVPYELSFMADGASTSFTVPDYYNVTTAHRAYLLHPERRQRTWGRALISGSMLSVTAPSHEIVHLLQHAAKQIDRSVGSWQAEHDASRCASALLVASLRELEHTHTAVGVDGRHISPHYLLPLLMASMVRGNVTTRSKPQLGGDAFRARVQRTLGRSERAAERAAASAARTSPAASAAAPVAVPSDAVVAGAGAGAGAAAIPATPPAVDAAVPHAPPTLMLRTGSSGCAVVPSPTWPEELFPQAQSVPSRRIAATCAVPTPSWLVQSSSVPIWLGTSRLMRLPSPSWPLPLRPHPHSVPSVFSAMVNPLLVAHTACQSLAVPTCPGAKRCVVVPSPNWPVVLMPHAQSVPSVFTARLKPLPAETARH